MPEVVKVKRPVSVWLSQLLIVVVLGFIASFIVSDLPDPVTERTFPSFSPTESTSVFMEAVGIVLIVCWIVGFLGMTFRFKFSRVLVIVLFALVFVWFLYNYFTDPEIRESWLTGDLSYNLGFFGFISFTFLPFVVLSLIFAFSRKVKVFFDPSLIPQIDESSAIFNEPPPPPRFDE